MQDRLGLNLNKNDRFALAEKFCYFDSAPVKSGVGVRSPNQHQRQPTFYRYGGLSRTALEAGRISGYGTSNSWPPATIRLEANSGRKEKITRGTTMKTSWCFLGGVCRRAINIFNQMIMPGSLFFGVAP